MRDWFKDYKWDNRPFLILGKGPTFKRPSAEDYKTYNILSLNDSVRECKVNVCHIIDIDVLDRCGDAIMRNCDVLVAPYYPHLGWRPNPLITLDELSHKQPVLRKLREQGRLYGYNLSTVSQMFNKRWNDSELVYASHFSAEAVVNLLGKLGVKTIRTLGVDGGKGQEEAFKDLQNINVNGYEAQWVNIRKSIKRFGLDYAPLGVESPIRIFVGAGEPQLVPALVLKHSILKHATMSVDVTIMNEWTHPMPVDPRNRPRIPFSFQRFMIPEKCGFKGKAIYMDSDMLVFGDVKEVWTTDVQGKLILAMRNDDVDKHKAKYSHILFNLGDGDCMDWCGCMDIIDCLNEGCHTYEDIVFNFACVDPEEIISGWNPDWNSLEEYTEGKTKLLHYTEMYNQPWLANPNHPLGHLWFNELKEAVTDGSISKDLVAEHVARRWLLPKCLEVLDGK